MNILVTLPLDQEQKQWIEQVSPNENYCYDRNPQPETIQKADIIIGNISPAQVPLAKNLKWLQLNSAGADTYCKPGIMPKGALLTNATGAYGLTISEFMIGTIIMLYKHLHLYSRFQTQHDWHPLGPIRSISGSTTLCIGLGDIGTEFCKKMKALGSHTIGVKRRPGQKPEGIDELYLNDKIDELLPQADIVALSLPGTAATNNMINRERFQKMKKDAILINVGRGNSVNTEDLIEALNTGTISGAILDVTNPEPLPKESPLWDMENVIITPHIAGGLFLRETLNIIVRTAAHNLEAFLQGKPLKNLVDFSTGYKK
jgi:phosphoglycerate dehydrogenase-like enzyme